MKIGINIKFGIAAGLINCIAWYMIARSQNYYSFNVEQYRYYVTLLLLLIGIPASVYFERRSSNGFIEFKNALKCGVLYSIVLALIIAIFNYVYYKFIVPDAIEYFVSEAKKSMAENKVKAEDIPKNIELVISYFGSFRMFMSTLIIGLLMSLGASAILRRKDPQAFQAN
jgi:hypothetical protein